MEVEIFAVEQAAPRLDRFLSERLTDFSRVKIQTAIREGLVLLNGHPAPRPAEPLAAGNVVSWTPPPPAPLPDAQPEDIALDVLFEDDALLVINKPAGMVVHPGAGNVSGTLVSALLFRGTALSGRDSTLPIPPTLSKETHSGESRESEEPGEPNDTGWKTCAPSRPGIVHRLDKETSGCLVVAKTDAAHAALAAQFAGREVKKTYLALVQGAPKRTFGTINAPIVRHPHHRQKMTVSTNERGREAVTDYRVLWSRDGVSLVQCQPLTGRTHQIRVHLRHLGHPVLGDPLYGRRGDFPRHMLHAWKLAFRHPATNEPLAFEAPPPVEWRAF